MAKYVILYKLTEKGIQNIKAAPGRAAESIARWEAAGGKVLAFYSTMGPYDYVAIVEGADEKAAAAFLLSQGSQGNVTTLTMRAFDAEEFAEIVAAIP